MINKQNAKRIINAVIFILLVAVTFYVVFKDNNIKDILAAVSQAKLAYILLAVGCMFLFIMGEGINIRRVLVTLGDNISIASAFKYALVGFFFSSVTPSASGGDPMQLYFMNKDKVSISHSALALLIEHASFQLTTSLLAIAGFFFNYRMLINNIGDIKYLMLIGMSINIAMLAVMVIMIFSKRMAHGMLLAVKTIMHSFYENGIKHLQDYHECSVHLKNNKKLFAKIIFTTPIQLFMFYSIPYLVYRSLGLNDQSMLTFVFMQAVLFVSVSSLPFPGAVGISEGSFMIMFKMLFPATLLGGAMLLSRGISFYLFVLVSGALILLFMLYDKYAVKKAAL